MPQMFTATRKPLTALLAAILATASLSTTTALAQEAPEGTNLFVRVFQSPDGTFSDESPLPGASVTISATDGEAEGLESALAADDQGMAGFGLLPPGTYTICVEPPETHAAVGSAANDGQGQVTGACREAVPVVHDDSRPFGVTVDFFAQPLASDTPTPTPTPFEDVAGVMTPGPGANPDATPTAVATDPTPAAPEAGTGWSAPGTSAAAAAIATPRVASLSSHGSTQQRHPRQGRVSLWLRTARER